MLCSKKEWGHQALPARQMLVASGEDVGLVAVGLVAVSLVAVRDQGGFPLRSPSANPLTGQRILVAEDESFIALELERMLESFGCEVVGPVSSVREVLQHAIQGDCDGALLDVNLRGQQIFEILPKLENLGLRLVIASGYNDVTLFPEAFRQVPRIAKPFDERDLRRICENVFAKSAGACTH